MNTDHYIRPVIPEDLLALKTVIERTELFPSDMLDAMIAGYFAGEDEAGFWLTYDDGEPVAVAFCAPERMTQGAWNALLLAVRPDYQGKGLGAALMDKVEQTLARREERILLVETSGLAAFERTRNFYRKNGYEEEARIREFYSEGEDKIVFRKVL